MKFAELSKERVSEIKRAIVIAKDGGFKGYAQLAEADSRVSDAEAEAFFEATQAA